MLNTKQVTIADGRDKGKVFIVTEMPARPAYRWALRALFALMNSGFEVPDELQSSGMAGLAVLGVKALGKANFSQMEPLLDELLTCVQVVPDPMRPNITRSDIDADIEDAKTYFLLQKEVLSLHFAPFMPGVESNGTSTPEASRAG